MRQRRGLRVSSHLRHTPLPALRATCPLKGGEVRHYRATMRAKNAAKLEEPPGTDPGFFQINARRKTRNADLREYFPETETPSCCPCPDRALSFPKWERKQRVRPMFSLPRPSGGFWDCCSAIRIGATTRTRSCALPTQASARYSESLDG